MFVILTNFFVQLVVENLLKVLKTQVFHILYFLDYCLFSRVRAYSDRGAANQFCAPPSIHDYVLAAACLVLLCWGTLALRGAAFNLLCMRQIFQICIFQSVRLHIFLLIYQLFLWLLYQPFLQRLWLLYQLPQGLRLTC